MKGQLLKRIERLQKAIGTTPQEQTQKGNFKYSIDEWTDEEIKEYFFRQTGELVAKAEETDWGWVRDNAPGSRLRRFLEGCTIDELRQLVNLAEEAEG